MPSNEFITRDKGNEWSSPGGKTTSIPHFFTDPGEELGEVAMESPELESQRLQRSQMTAPHFSGDPSIPATVEQDYKRRRDQGRVALTADQDRVLDDAADFILQLQRNLRKIARVEEVRYLSLQPQRRGSTGHIIEGMMNWRWTLRSYAKRRRVPIQVAIPIRQGVFQEPTVFLDGSGRVYPWTDEGFEKLFGDEIERRSPDTGIGLAVKDNW